MAFWDGTHGNGPWTQWGADCTRTDPCKSGCGQGEYGGYAVCNTAGTSITHVDLESSNLVGTISPLVGAWTDITYFDVCRNALSGRVPASVGNWTKLTNFYVYGNKFEGGVLPAGLPYSQIRTGFCKLFEEHATNKFECPWPAGAKDNCVKWDHSSPQGFVPITDADCITLVSPVPRVVVENVVIS